MINKISISAALILLSPLAVSGSLELGVSPECNDTPDWKYVYTINIANQKVMRSAYYLDGAPLGTPGMLENCSVVDDLNWRCGGEAVDLPNGRSVVNSTMVVSNGVMYHTPAHRVNADGSAFFLKQKNGLENYCFFTKGAQGYKRQPYVHPH